MATKYFTFRKNVRLLTGQIVRFAKGHGYYAGAPDKKPSGAQIRAKLQTLMAATVANEPNWHYAEIRPISHLVYAQAVCGVVKTDCSGGCTALCQLAGAKDPTGNNYNGTGNSTSMYVHLPHIENYRDTVLVGDLAVFGKTNGEEHVAMVYKIGGSNPTLWSHGQERGPLFVSLDDEAAAHPGAKVTFLRLAT